MYNLLPFEVLTLEASAVSGGDPMATRGARANATPRISARQ